MRIIKYLLALLLAVTALLFAMTEIRERVSGKSQGPSIVCDTDTVEISVRDGEDALLTGITARDPQDGDLTGSILVGGISKLITEDTARVTYLVFDSDDNMGTCTRYVRYTDYQRPRFRVDKPLVYTTAGPVRLQERITVLDDIDDPDAVQAALRVSSLWATENENVFSATVQVTNSMGDTARVSLPVIYRERGSKTPEIRLREQLLYLEAGSDFDPKDYLSAVTSPGEIASVKDVKIDNPVDTSKPGTYWVWYTYTGPIHPGVAILTVVVQESRR